MSETEIDKTGSGAEFPPPPPPQLARRKSKDEATNSLFFIKINISILAWL